MSDVSFSDGRDDRLSIRLPAKDPSVRSFSLATERQFLGRTGGRCLMWLCVVCHIFVARIVDASDDDEP